MTDQAPSVAVMVDVYRSLPSDAQKRIDDYLLACACSNVSRRQSSSFCSADNDSIISSVVRVSAVDE